MRMRDVDKMNFVIRMSLENLNHGEIISDKNLQILEISESVQQLLGFLNFKKASHKWYWWDIFERQLVDEFYFNLKSEIVIRKLFCKKQEGVSMLRQMINCQSCKRMIMIDKNNNIFEVMTKIQKNYKVNNPSELEMIVMNIYWNDGAISNLDIK